MQHTVSPIVLAVDEQLVYSKHVEDYYWNKLRERSASFWSLLNNYITMHGPQNGKVIDLLTDGS